MTDLWSTSPLPAMRIWRSGNQTQFGINPAAQDWAVRAGIDEQDWRILAEEQIGQPGVAELVFTLGKRSDHVRCRRIATADGVLLWLQPEETLLSRFLSAEEQLELMREHGRMGMVVRDLDTGEGEWDKHVFDIMGLDPHEGTPPFDVAATLVHPDDQASFTAQHQSRAGQPGRYSMRFRILRPDGELRYLNSLYEIRARRIGAGRTLISLLIDETEGVKRYQAQRDASDMLAKALSLSGISVWQLDLQRRQMYFNDHGFRLLGMPETSDGLPLDMVRALIHPSDVAAIARAADEAVQSDRVVDVMARYADGQGAWRHLLTRRFANRDEAGRVLSLMGVSLDLTELVQERDRSLALLDRMQLVTDAINIGFWWRDLDEGTLEWDERMFRLHHRDPSEGTPSLDEFLERHVHPEDRAWLQERQEQHIALWPESSEVTFRIVDREGGTRWVQTWTRRLRRDGRRLSFGMHVDVSERRETELRIERERERDRFAIEAAGVGVWEEPVDGRPVYWNATMYRLRGLDPDDRRPVSELVGLTTALQDIGAAQAQLDRCLRGEAEYRHEFMVCPPGGGSRWLLSIGHVVSGRLGQVIAVAGVTVDITERRLAEALARERDRAEQASAAKSELMARVSHELRTPMNAVLGFAELMALDALTPSQLDRLHRIRSAGGHLLSLIDDLLELARADASARPIVFEAVALDELLREACQWVEPLARDAGVRLVLPGPQTETAWVLADRRRLGQVITNLLTNAVKYNHRGGTVNLTIDASRIGDDMAWELQVRDDGRGMSADQLARLFEPFNRLGVEREGIPGTGIGLSIVQRLVDVMGGRLGVDSQPGHGSVFSVRLRAAADSVLPVPAASDRAAGLAESPAPADPVRVLYVEDNPVNEMLVRQMLALQPGIALSCAPDGLSGIDMALRVRPQIVLLDLQLPDIPGAEVLARLRGQPTLAGAVFVALSANAMPDDVQTALALGFDAYWTKPLDVARFMRDIGQLADAARQRLPVN